MDNQTVIKNSKSNIIENLSWKLLERFGVQGVQFILQIILARLLSPEHYGYLSLMLIFITLANVFIQNGFNTALIQNKELTDEDYSSVFWITLIVSAVLYGGLYAVAPTIGRFYGMTNLAGPFRVLALVLFPGTFNSIQLAKVSRELNFKKVFFSNIGAIVISGLVGIILAFIGAGVWALVIQYLLNVSAACIIMRVTVKWHLQFVCDLQRVRILFAYGWKLLVSSLLDTLYQDLSSLVIGKKYNTGILGYYNRGKQFPQFIISAINGAIQSVMLPVMSAKQDERSQVKALTRNSIMLSSYIIFPLMAGLAGVASPLVRILLTDKWLPCVPFLQIFCFSLSFWPVHTSNLQAINAMGRSDIFLKLEIIKKVLGILALIITVMCFSSPIAIAMTGVFTGVISCFINAYPNKRLINYSYKEQVEDILPSFFISIAMFICISLLANLKVGIVYLLIIKVLAGIIV